MRATHGRVLRKHFQYCPWCNQVLLGHALACCGKREEHSTDNHFTEPLRNWVSCHDPGFMYSPIIPFLLHF